MTIRHHRILWFFGIYGFSLAIFAALTILIRMLVRYIVR